MDVFAFPRGYLALMQAATTGRAIPQATEFIQPGIDVERFLGANQRKAYFDNIAGGNMVTGQNFLFTVPNKLVWIVRALSANMGPVGGAGNVANRATIFMIPPESANSSAIFMSENVTADGATDSRGTLLWRYPDLILNPGTRIGVLATITGNVTLSSLAYVDELQA